MCPGTCVTCRYRYVGRNEGAHIMPEEKLTVEELKKKAEKPGKDAMILHPFYKGKIQSIGKAPVRDFSDFAIWIPFNALSA